MESKTPNSKRQLVAILFADIVGYTSLMQHDEQNASTLLRQFQKQLKEKVPSYNGRIANFYGDGALCIFPLSIDAIRCAMDLQMIFDQIKGDDELKIPVRIGIHFGKVTFEGEHAYGHSINLTSRIESMGVPGAILFSGKVKADIQDQSNLQMISFDSFEFKNVDEPIEVFALANKGFRLPRRVELKGKFKEQKNNPQPLEKSIAVLAFENRSGDPTDEFFGDGISEEIIYALSKLKQLKVAGRVSSFSFKGKNIDSVEIGKKLQVHNLLVGSVQKRGNRVRVTTQLVNAVNGFQIWTERFDREMEDIFAIQDEIALNIAEKLKLTLLVNKEKTLISNRQTDNLEAYKLYLQGRHYLDQRSSLDLAISYYEKAISLDPNYALAYSGLSYVYFYQILFDFKAPKLFIKAQEAARKAMELNPDLAEAYIIDGIVYFYYYWNPTKAWEQYEKALAINPNYDIYRIMAYYQSMMNHPEEAERLALKAVELDPLNLGAELGLGEIFYRSSKFHKAIVVLEKLIEKIPGNKVANALLGASYYHGQQKEKTHEFYSNLELDNAIVLFYNLPKFNYLIENGHFDSARQILQTIENDNSGKWISPVSIAMLYFGIGDMEKAETYLHQGLQERDPMLPIIHSEPTWAKFRNHLSIKTIFEQRFLRR